MSLSEPVLIVAILDSQALAKPRASSPIQLSNRSTKQEEQIALLVLTMIVTWEFDNAHRVEAQEVFFPSLPTRAPPWLRSDSAPPST